MLTDKKPLRLPEGLLMRCSQTPVQSSREYLRSRSRVMAVNSSEKTSPEANEQLSAKP